MAFYKGERNPIFLTWTIFNPPRHYRKATLHDEWEMFLRRHASFFGQGLISAVPHGTWLRWESIPAVPAGLFSGAPDGAQTVAEL